MITRFGWVMLTVFCGVLLMSAGPMYADTMGSLSLSDCGSGQSGCPAATYSFDITGTSASLTIHITGAVTAGVNDHIGGVDLGFTRSNNLVVLTVTGPDAERSTPSVASF